MSAVRRVTKNTVLLNFARVVSTLGKFFLFIYIARELGQETLGQFSFAIIFTSFFGIIIALGMDDLLVREVARDNTSSRKYLGNIFVMRLVLSILAFSIIVLAINLMGYPPSTRVAVYIFGGYVIFSSFNYLLRANFRAFEKMEWDALIETMEAVLTTGVGLILVFTGFGLIPLSLVFLSSSVLNVTIGLLINRCGFAGLKPEIDFKFWKDILLKSIPFAIFGLFILYPQVDTILLSNLKGDIAVGKYTAAFYIVTAFSPVVMNFMIALVPLISRYFISARDMLKFVYEKSVKYLLIIAFPISAGATILGDRIIRLLYGAGYEDSVLALKIIAWNCVLLAISRPMFYILGAINRQGTCAIITLTALALSICLNLYLIPHISYLGSAIITLINGILVILASWYATGRFGFPLNINKVFWKPLAASAIMGVIIYSINILLDPGLAVLIFLGIITYVAAIIGLRGFAGDDWNLLKQAINLRAGNIKAQIPPEDKHLKEAKRSMGR